MSDTPKQQRAGAVLTIDLDALTSNWRLYADKARGSNAKAGAVIKASAYGLDVARVAPALHLAGCDTFFVATIDEAIQIRNILGKIDQANPSIHVFYGLMDGCERDFSQYDLIPVLNTLGEVEAWRAFCGGLGTSLPCDIHIDTGMSRLGLDEHELQKFITNMDQYIGLNINTIMSHLACAETPEHIENKRQLERFTTALSKINFTQASLANSSGAFLGPNYHFDLIRPGVALYGANPTPDKPNPMKQVVRLQGKVLQVRAIDTPRGVGYGSTFEASQGTRIATLAMGYADGYPRSLSNVGEVYFGEHKAPIVGRVSMDLITIDVTDIPAHIVHVGQLADVIGPLNPIDDVADKAGTIGYELLTQLGSRYDRKYTGGN